MARALAKEVFFGDEVLQLSSLTGNGKWNDVRLKKLDNDKMEEIEDTIKRFYRSKTKNVHALWEGCFTILSLLNTHSRIVIEG